MSDIRCIGIATGGGDAPGLNAVIRAAAKAAVLKYTWKVIGIPDGFDGLILPENLSSSRSTGSAGFCRVGERFWAPLIAAILSAIGPGRMVRM